MASKPEQRNSAHRAPRGPRGNPSAKTNAKPGARAERRKLRKAAREARGGMPSVVSQNSMPTAYGSRISQRPSSTGHAVGTLVLAEVSQPGGSLSGDQQVVTVNINPFLLGYFVGGSGALVGSAVTNRLSAMAQLYAEFRLKKLKVRYVPSCPTSTQGMVLLAFSENPNMGVATAMRTATGLATPAASRGSSIFQEYANLPSLEFNVWAPAAWDVPVSKGWKQVDPFQAVGLYAVEASAGIMSGVLHDVSTASAANYGTLHADYECEFRSPTWAPGYNNIEDAITPTFTTIASTAGQAQILKYTEVGVAATFSGTYKGPMMLIPRSTLTLGDGTNGQTIPAGTPLIAAVYYPSTYVGYDTLALYATMSDLTNGNYIQVTNGTTTPVVFEADLMAISVFGS